MMATHTKRAAVFLAAILCGAVAAPTAASAANTPAATVDARTAVVRVSIQQADGTKLRATKVVDWGSVAQFDLAGHDLDLTVSDRNHLDVAYSRDGAKVADKRISATPRKAVVVHDDAGAKITVQVIPTKVHIETSPL